MESNPGPEQSRTNRETSSWLRDNIAQNHTMRENLEKARLFFGKFSGDHRTFVSWKEDFLRKQKSMRKDAQERLMKDVGGTGKYYATPPNDYCPPLEKFRFILEDYQCEKCNYKLTNEATMISHIKSVHNNEIQKMFASDAREYIEADETYHKWLNDFTDISKDGRIDQLEKANRFLLERAAGDNKEMYKKVDENKGIIETQTEFFTQNVAGTPKRSVVRQQFVNVTKRKSCDSETVDNDDQKKAKIVHKKQSDTVKTVLNHLAGDDVESKASLLAKIVDSEGPEFAEALLAKSKELKEHRKLTPAETAAVIAGSGLTDYQADQIRTACNNTIGSSPFASRQKVKEARKENLVITKDDWEASYEDLYKNKQGKYVNIKKKTCVYTVRNLLQYIEKLAEEEADNLVHSEELLLCLGGDGGGGRFVAEFAFLSTLDKSITLHPVLIYEGTDCRENLTITLGKLTPQIRQLEGASVNIKGRQLRIKVYAVFDLCALNAILGKQGSSATFFDPWTNTRLDHIRNHKGNEHTPDKCQDITFLDMKSLDKNFTHHALETGGSKKTGQHYGSVTGVNLVPLPHIFRYVCPLMHTIMGLGNAVFNELKTVVKTIDSSDTVMTAEKELKQKETLKTLYEEKEKLDIIFSNYNLDKMILINDSERVEALLDGKIKEAEKIAHSNYEPFDSKKKKKDCGSEMCLIFPIDERNGFADKVKCQYSCVVHARCEGIILLDGEELPETFTCKRCDFKEGNREWLQATIQNGLLTFTHEIQKLSVRLTQLKMQIEIVEEDDCGKRQQMLKDACKSLNLNPARYHGGDFEGKAIQEMLECARNGKFVLLDCVRDKPEVYDKFKRALSTLQEASDSLRRSWEDFDDNEVKIVKQICERWGENWLKDFPHLNITPKGHDLIFVLPEFSKKTRSFHMFYKLEERGESIHKDLNAIERRIWCIRQPEERLWKYIEKFELRNLLDIKIVRPERRKKRNG